jgi:hypothetical protein
VHYKYLQVVCARPAATVAASPACSYGQPSSHRRVSCSALPPQRIIGPALNDLPCTLEDAEEELHRIAAPGSSWLAEARAPLQAAADALGGHWFVVDCGKWDEGHPRAGMAAFALLQMTFITVTADSEERKYTGEQHLASCAHAVSSSNGCGSSQACYHDTKRGKTVCSCFHPTGCFCPHNLLYSKPCDRATYMLSTYTGQRARVCSHMLLLVLLCLRSLVVCLHCSNEKGR